MHVNQNLIYRELTKDPSNIYSLLLMSGYLKVSWKELMPDGLYLCELSIPNKEISMVYKQEILSYLVETGFMSRSTADQIAISLYTMNFKKLQDTLSEYMTHSISFYDGGTEGFYHGMIIGLVAMLDNKYHVRSNRESGDGRYDVCLFPKEKEYPGIIMEFKWKAGLDLEKLEELAKEAREQIDVNRYDIEITEYKVTDIIKIGIAFSGKQAKVYPNKR